MQTLYQINMGCNAFQKIQLSRPLLICRSDHHWSRITDDAWINSFDEQHRDAAYRREFRMDFATFQELVILVSPFMQRQNTVMRDAIHPRRRIACALYRLAHGASYSVLSSHFGIGASTAQGIFIEFCEVLCQHFLQRVIRMPSGSELAQQMNKFGIIKRFPACFGAIDGIHIAIEKPARSPLSYHCRKGFYSIVLSAAVNFDGLFIDIDAGFPGRAHDSRVFRESWLGRQSDNHYGYPVALNISGVPIKPYLLGDPAYPLKSSLLRGFTGRNLSEPQVRFNEKLSSARMCIERAFGRLKGRFRILNQPLEGKTIKRHVQTVMACCIVHNWCEANPFAFDGLMQP